MINFFLDLQTFSDVSSSAQLSKHLSYICMKALIFILSFLVIRSTAFSQTEHSIAIAEAMASTFNIRIDETTGTCFMVTKDKKQYFLTAAHLFPSSHKSGNLNPIEMLIQNEWRSFNARVYFHTDRKIDIALVILSERVLQNLEFPEELSRLDSSAREAQGNGISLDPILADFGKEVFFYGFPLGNLGSEVFGIKFPLVKKATVSGSVRHNGVNMLLLDGHNNLGFSGGPVVAYNISSKKMCIVGIISGYVPEPIDVQYKGDKLSVNDNSGIIICYGRRYIEEVLTKNEKDLR